MTCGCVSSLASQTYYRDRRSSTCAPTDSWGQRSNSGKFFHLQSIRRKEWQKSGCARQALWFCVAPSFGLQLAAVICPAVLNAAAWRLREQRHWNLDSTQCRAMESLLAAGPAVPEATWGASVGDVGGARVRHPKRSTRLSSHDQTSSWHLKVASRS